MANYFYVKNGLGTRTADTGFTAAESGAFGSGNLTAANTYADLSVVQGLTTKPKDGDFILLSDAHTKAYSPGVNVAFNATGAVGGSGLMVISVDDSNADQYSPGATENFTSTSRVEHVYKVLCAGLSLETDGYVIFFGISNTESRIQDATLTVDTTSDVCMLFSTNADGAFVRLTNVDINFNNAGATAFSILSGCSVIWQGGALTGTAPTNLCLATNFGIWGGATCIFDGVDLSLCAGTIMPNCVVGAQDKVFFKLSNCKLNASVTLHGTLQAQYHRFEMYNCDDSAGVYHRFYVADGSGSAANNDATYVTATESWYEGSDKSSIAVITTALCSHITPFVFELPAQYVDLGDTAKDTLTIDLVSIPALTDTDIAAFLCYPDGTTAVIPRWVTSGKTVDTPSSPIVVNYGIDPLAAGTALSASSLGAGDWTGESASPIPNFYKMVLDTSGVAGEATAVSIRIEVYTPSILAGELFIHPLITVSAT